ncbi:MAG: ABC transporter permease [Candidatus Bathyarchaeota archaeon]|nr:MAG: ABC transporter permease [Candidatus Bathyarchaeota archaeon]
MRITVMCFRNLLRRRLRTTLCIFGISLATVFIVAIGATTSHYTNVIRDMNIFFAGKIVAVPEGAMVVQGFPVVGGNIPENIVEELSQVEGVSTAVPMLVRFGYQIETVVQLAPSNITVGVPYGNWSTLVGRIPLESGGKWPSVNDEVVLGQSIARQYGLEVGATFRAKDVNLTVSGILDSRSALLLRSIIVPLDMARELHYPNLEVNWIGNMVVVTFDPGLSEEQVAEKIRTEVLGIEALTTDLRNEIVEPLLSDIETWNSGITTVLYALSMVLITLVAMINISERRRDFATLDAIGAPKQTIFRIVVTEIMVMGLIGCIIGVVVGSFSAILFASLYTEIPLSLFLAHISEIVSPWLIIRVLVSTVAVAGVAGMIPAVAATRVNIAAELRSEY